MTKTVERTALILLAGAALTACATPRYAINAPVIQPPPAPPAAPLAPSAPIAVAREDRPAQTPQPSAPVEVKQLAQLPPTHPAPSAAAALAQAESVPVLAFPPPAVDAAARSRTRSHKAAAEPVEPSTYTVRKGDTLAKVADKLGVDLTTLAKANGLKKPYRLSAGQELKNPNASAAVAEGASGRSRARNAPQSYTVRSGDTLFSIAKRFGTTVDALRAENGLGRSSGIAKGRKLKLPGGEAEVREEAAAEPTARRGREPVSEEAAPAARGAAGRVTEVSMPGKAYRVRKGDSLEKVARKLDSEVGELARINHLKKPYHLRPGQTVRGPGSSAKAYVVARGDNLAAIAERFGVSESAFRSANGLRRGASVAPGRKLRLPAGSRDHGPIRELAEAPSPRTPAPVGPTLPAPHPATEGLPSAPQPYSGGAVAAGPAPSVQISDAQIMQMGRGLFSWPLRGDVLSGFGIKGPSQRNDGLDIRANAGDPVRAAAAGDVIYAGDQVPGFGNLVLISHPDGWVTAYSNLGRIEVRMREKVSQGQEIGEAGSTGGVPAPQLHFEVRYRANAQEKYRAVDPTLVLPK